MPFRVPAVDNHPAHRTLGDLRAPRLAELLLLFLPVLRRARERGLMKLGSNSAHRTKLQSFGARALDEHDER